MYRARLQLQRESTFLLIVACTAALGKSSRTVDYPSRSFPHKPPHLTHCIYHSAIKRINPAGQLFPPTPAQVPRADTTTADSACMFTLFGRLAQLTCILFIQVAWKAGVSLAGNPRQRACALSVLITRTRTPQVLRILFFVKNQDINDRAK